MVKKKSLTVVKPNSIAEARGGMSRSFLDLLDVSLNQVVLNGDDPERLDYKFSIEDYADKFGLAFNKNAFKKLRLASKDALKKDNLLSIRMEDSREMDFVVFQSILYNPEENSITVKFGEEFKRLLCEMLKMRGLKILYSLPDTLQMDSEYTKKMYPILLERVHKTADDRMIFSAKGTLKGEAFDRIDVFDNFKELLKIPSSYKTSNIKDMCNCIVQEIQRCTPYTAEVFYNEAAIGRGRPKVTHICWRIEPKEGIEAAAENAKYAAMILETAKAAGIDKLTQKDAEAISKKAVLHGLDPAAIKRRINTVAKYKGHVNSIVGLLVFAMTPQYDENKEYSYNSFSSINRKDAPDLDAIALKKLMAKFKDSE